jgi:hypothetical protein
MRSLAAAIVTALTALAIGCGGGEETFSANEFVDRANQGGAGIELREELVTTDPELEIWGVSFSGSPSGAAAAPGTDLAHGAGSLAVAADAEAGRAEFARCEAAASLICFRAANVVVRLEGANPDEIARLREAVAAMESG